MLSVISKKSIKHDYSVVMAKLPVLVAQSVRKWGIENIDDHDVYEENGKYGREKDIHITVKYGLHTNSPIKIRKILKVPSFSIRLGQVTRFDFSDDYDVLKLEVESKKLHELNTLISDNFICTDTHKVYRPHITIAYVNKSSNADLIGAMNFEGKAVKINRLVFTSKTGESEAIDLI